MAFLFLKLVAHCKYRKHQDMEALVCTVLTMKADLLTTVSIFTIISHYLTVIERVFLHHKRFSSFFTVLIISYCRVFGFKLHILTTRIFNNLRVKTQTCQCDHLSFKEINVNSEVCISCKSCLNTKITMQVYCLPSLYYTITTLKYYFYIHLSFFFL